MQKDVILEILSDWNFWAKEIDTGIKREDYVRKLSALVSKTNQIICITGIRRSGKTTIIRQMAKELGKDNTLIANFEDERFLDKNLDLLIDIKNTYFEKIKPKNKPFIFLDEIQNVPNWERFARGMHERKEANIIVSGSSSKLLSEELATLLTGRHITFLVYPLSFREFLNFKQLPIQTETDILANRTKIKGMLSEYLEFGGFPEVCLSSEKNRILMGYFETIVAKDIADRFKIREKEKAKILAKYYLTNISSPITFNKISKFLNLPLTTVERFSSYIETANMVFFISKFCYSLKEQKKSPRKVYSIDTGLSNAIGFRFIAKLGKIMENIVALQLKIIQSFDPEIEIYYWKDSFDREVDFIVKKGLKVKKLIQVCYNIDDMNTKERETRSLLKAMKEFNLRSGLIITEDYEFEEEIDKKKIKYVPLWKWLLKNFIKKEDLNR